jgi:hypothetical protein
MLRDNKLRPLNSGPCLPMLSEGVANRSDLPNYSIEWPNWLFSPLWRACFSFCCFLLQALTFHMSVIIVFDYVSWGLSLISFMLFWEYANYLLHVIVLYFHKLLIPFKKLLELCIQSCSVKILEFCMLILFDNWKH